MNRRGHAQITIDALLQALLRVCRHARAPRIAAAMLTAALLATALHDGLDVYSASVASGGQEQGRGMTNVMHSDGTFSPAALKALVRAHLFGISPLPPNVGTSAARDASLVLTGTIAAHNPSLGYALIGTSKDRALLHPVGDSIVSGVVLRAVYRDHVIVERGGQLAAIFLPRGAGFLATQRATPGTDSPAADVTEGTTPDSPQQDIAQTLEQESAHTAAFLRQEPFYSQGQFRGIVIEPGTDPGMLAQMGLKAGDVLQHVDGAVVAQPDRLAMLRERLASGGTVTVSVIRPGVGPVDLTINGNLVAAMIEN